MKNNNVKFASISHRAVPKGANAGGARFSRSEDFRGHEGRGRPCPVIAVTVIVDVSSQVRVGGF